ncbi:MAG: hypothetical protein ACJ8AD_19155 [Gemmatimonadaceae bacterium]
MATDGNALPSLDAAALQFDAPQQQSTPQAMSCAMCSQPIQSVYYETGGSVVCAPCRGKLESSIGSSGKGGRVLRASGLGFLAAVAGSVVYYAIRAATGYEIGIVAILVGWGVGRGVFLGSGRRGGRGYQSLAVGLTYLAIATTYLPLAREELMDRKAASTAADSSGARPDTAAAAVETPAASADTTSPAAAAPAATQAKPATSEKLGVGGVLLGIIALLAFSIALPIFVGISSPISILILFFGLAQAWRMNKRVDLSVSGPYRLAPTAASAAQP